MKELRYTVRFNTPAFLGNAEQAGQWRTPPFKALLRQWWRVAYAAERNFDVSMAEMRREEGCFSVTPGFPIGKTDVKLPITVRAWCAYGLIGGMRKAQDMASTRNGTASRG